MISLRPIIHSRPWYYGDVRFGYEVRSYREPDVGIAVPKIDYNREKTCGKTKRWIHLCHSGPLLEVCIEVLVAVLHNRPLGSCLRSTRKHGRDASLVGVNHRIRGEM